MTTAHSHRRRTSASRMIVFPHLPVISAAVIVALRALPFSRPSPVASVLFVVSLLLLTTDALPASAASATLPRVRDFRAGFGDRGGGCGANVVLPPPSALVTPHSAWAGRWVERRGGFRGGISAPVRPQGYISTGVMCNRGRGRCLSFAAVPPPPTSADTSVPPQPPSSGILATAPAPAPIAEAGVVGADITTDSATVPRVLKTTDGTEGAEARVRVRRADPDEVRALSSLVAECFATSRNATTAADDDIRSKSYRRSNDLLASIIAAAVERFVLRWMVFAGMIERLVRSSFAAGYAEGSGGGEGGGMPGGLFVAELVDVDEDETTMASSSSSSSPVVVGVVELAPPGPCPIPLGFSTEGKREGKKRTAPFVCNLAVLDGHRNIGVGRSLLRRCEAECRRDGRSSEVWLETLDTNVAALRLYQSEGYVCEGVDPEFDRGARRSFRRVYMRKRLTDDSPEYYGAGYCGGGVGAGAGAGACTDDVMLRIVPRAEADGGGWTAEFDDLGGDKGGPSCIIEPTFAERYLGGVLGPAVVAVAGVLIGLPVRLSRITR